MKKVLIIAHYFPPSIYIGAQRFYKFAKYFPENGWEPVILTVRLSGQRPKGFRIIETDEGDVVLALKRKLGLERRKNIHKELGIPITKEYRHSSYRGKAIKLAREIVTIVDEKRGWYKYAVKAASELMSQEKIDMIVSTSSPEISHVIARRLKRQFRVPWVADLRDLWTQNHFYEKYGVIKFLERQIEVRTLREADTIVTVSEPLVTTLRELHRKQRIECVTNGYDDEEFPKMSARLTSKFTITYTGTLYNGKRDPSQLFEAVQQLIEAGTIRRDIIEIQFYGQREEWLTEEIRKYGLADVVTVNGLLSREKVLEKQRESQLLLLLMWNNRNEEGVYTGKIFEYLGSRRPILAMGGPGGVVKELLEKTNAGVFAENIDVLKNYLLSSYFEFIERGEVTCGSDGTIDYYSYRGLTKRYAKVLDALV